MDTFGIKYEQVIYQSENIKFHRNFVSQLLRGKQAFLCFCTKEMLDEKRELSKKNRQAYRYDDTCLGIEANSVINNELPFVVRLRKPNNTIKFQDEIKGNFSFNPNDIDSFVISRDDHTPTYNFACSIDDMLMDISLVIRGEDHVSNTPKQIAIRDAIGYDKKIKYAHLPIILNTSGKKMSKRDDESSVQWLLDEGFLPETITNYLLLIGNKPPYEIFSLEDATKWFDIENISKAPVKFDIDKLRQLNREQIKIMPNQKLSDFFKYPRDMGELIKFYTQEGSTRNEIKPKVCAIFMKKAPLKGFEEEFLQIENALQQKSSFENFDELKAYVISETKLKGKSLFKPLRYILTGAQNGPNLSELYPLIKENITF